MRGCPAAQTNGNSVSYVVNRNINYTNICYQMPVLRVFQGKLSETCAADPTIYPMKKSPGARKKPGLGCD